MTAAKVELGRYLFYDTRLSGNGTYACASCHRQELAFTDGRARAVGSTGELHPRAAMSLANVAYNETLTWADPTIRLLEEQALVPMFNERPVELGLEGRAGEAMARLRSDDRYTRMFTAAFPGEEDPMRVPNVAKALASFQRTFISGDSPYNRLVYHGETDAVSDSGRRGMNLFFSERMRCSECHVGFNFSGPVAFRDSGPMEPAFHNTGLYNLDERGAYPPGSQGLHETTGKPEDMGRFRAPTLYNVELTGPYMHDGSVETLEEVLEIYAAGGRNIPSGRHAGDGRLNPHKSHLMAGFEMSRQEKEDLVSFLKSLTDEQFTSDPRFSDPFESP